MTKGRIKLSEILSIGGFFFVVLILYPFVWLVAASPRVERELPAGLWSKDTRR